MKIIQAQGKGQNPFKLMCNNNEKPLTYDQWLQENPHLNIFDCPQELRIDGYTGIATLHYPHGNKTLCQVVDVHHDGNYSILEEKII